MPNLSSISAGTTGLTALSNLIAVTPNSNLGYQPQSKTPPNGILAFLQQPTAILFHYEGEQTMTIESDITDHYIEDNTALQDQIALRPETVTTHGYIGELNDIPPAALAAIQAIANRLTVISAYTPVLSSTALLAYNEAFLAYQLAANAVNSAVSAVSSIAGAISGTPGQVQSKQQAAFQQFYGYWQQRTLFTVQTPWGIFKDMAIKSLRVIQDAETNVISDFEVSFKRIRVAPTALNLFSTVSLGRAADAASGITDLGTSPANSGASTSVGAENTAYGVA